MPNIPYDSDHNGLIANIYLNQTESLELESKTDSYQYNYKNTNWHHFGNYLNENCKLNIPSFKNLNNNETDQNIETIEKNIQKAINKATPKIKPKNSLDKYLNPKITKKAKSFLITQIQILQKQLKQTIRRDL